MGRREYPRGRALKKEIERLMRRGEEGDIGKILSYPPRAVINPLFGLLLSTDPSVRWHTIVAMGECPEAMGEILARNRKLAEEFAPIVVSYVREDGNFLEYEALQPGAIWAVGRLAQAWPDLVKGAGAYILPFLSSRAPQTRGVAIWALSYLGDRDLVTRLRPFVQDSSELEIYRGGVLSRVTYRGGVLSRVTVGQLAKEALSHLSGNRASSSHKTIA
ncbi:MAG: HEAT repeat domain-containing protein [Deltaproteobacteria bacterium]|nr:HEAT repeat domain-containing protein [Deltaproteobacteria bacterium]